jgi:hypothetical protein
MPEYTNATGIPGAQEKCGFRMIQRLLEGFALAPGKNYCGF